jgi:hypothetical protein
MRTLAAAQHTPGSRYSSKATRSVTRVAHDRKRGDRSESRLGSLSDWATTWVNNRSTASRQPARSQQTRFRLDMRPCELARERANPAVLTFNPKVAGSNPARPIASEKARVSPGQSTQNIRTATKQVFKAHESQCQRARSRSRKQRRRPSTSQTAAHRLRPTTARRKAGTGLRSRAYRTQSWSMRTPQIGWNW